MSYLRLDEVCNLKMGQSPDSGSYNQERDGIPFFQGNADFGEMHPVTRTWCNNPTKVVDKGTLLISVRAPIGALNFAVEKSCIGRGLAGITAKNEYDLKYIYYALKYKNRELKDKGTGSTFKAISKSTLGKVLIRDMTIENQRECIKRLDLIYKIFVLKKEKIRQYDELIKSRFVEMFGDPLQPANSKPLGDMALLERGKFSPRPRNDPQYYNGVYPFVQTGDVANCNHRLVSYHQTLNEKGIKVSKCFSPGTILIALVGATIGATAILEIDAYAPDSLIGITPKPNVCNNVFLEVLLQFWQPELKRIAPEAARANINLGILENVPIIDADFSMQEDFAAFVREIDKSKFATQKALTETQQLFDSLMQKYFG